MAFGGHMSPSLAPPAGGFKCRDDEYWNKHDGLMTLTWSHKIDKQERLKNSPMSINLRSLSASSLPEMTLRPTQRPRTVPADLSKEEIGGRRLLAQLGDTGSAPGTPGRRSRKNSTADLRRNAHHNMFHFHADMGKAEPLTSNQAVMGMPQKRRMIADGTSTPIMNSRSGSGTATPIKNSMNMSPSAYTSNQMYGARANEGGSPPDAHVQGRKLKTVSNVVMGM
jgi:hypothetical protein